MTEQKRGIRHYWHVGLEIGLLTIAGTLGCIADSDRGEKRDAPLPTTHIPTPFATNTETPVPTHTLTASELAEAIATPTATPTIYPTVSPTAITPTPEPSAAPE